MGCLKCLFVIADFLFRILVNGSVFTFQFSISLYSLTSSRQGRLLARAGKFSHAADVFEEALKLRYGSKNGL